MFIEKAKEEPAVDESKDEIKKEEDAPEGGK